MGCQTEDRPLAEGSEQRPGCVKELARSGEEHTGGAGGVCKGPEVEHVSTERATGRVDEVRSETGTDPTETRAQICDCTVALAAGWRGSVGG